MQVYFKYTERQRDPPKSEYIVYSFPVPYLSFVTNIPSNEIKEYLNK